LAGIVWTVLIITVPTLRFSFEAPRARPILETASAVVALTTAAVAFVRATITGPASWWFIGTAFVLLALNRFVFGVILPPDALGPSLAFHIWSAGRLLAGGLLLLGGLGRFRSTARTWAPRRALILTALPATVGLVVVTGLLLAGRSRLPPLTSTAFTASDVSGPLPGLTPEVIAIGTLGALLFLAATVAYLLPVQGDLVSIWLPPALVLAALSQVHSTLSPTAFSAEVATGDFLRLGFSLLLLSGIIHDVWSAYAAERVRSQQLAAAYLAERGRVEDMESLERAKEDFFSILTHELMHPVAALRGLAVTLDSRWDQLDEATKRDFVGRLTSETGRLRDLAEQSATALNIEDRQFSIMPRSEPVAELLREIAEVNVDLGGRLRIDLGHGAHEANVVADRTRVMQVVRNLVSNAVKYSDPDTPILLGVEASDEEVTFSVIDRGPGIPAEILPRLFRRFSRIRTPGKESVAGSGLGLYISKRIVEAHGGRIWVDAAGGSGTTVTFTLPRRGPIHE